MVSEDGAARSPEPPARSTDPAWVRRFGSWIGLLTLIFLMVLVLRSQDIDCSKSGIITLIFCLGVGLSSAFIGGYARATGTFDWSGIGAIPFALTGGLAAMAIAGVAANYGTTRDCVKREKVVANPDLLGLIIRGIPEGFKIDPVNRKPSFVEESSRRTDFGGDCGTSKEDGSKINCQMYDYAAVLSFTDSDKDEIIINIVNNAKIFCQLNLRYGRRPTFDKVKERVSLLDKIGFSEKFALQFTLVREREDKPPGAKVSCFKIEIGGISKLLPNIVGKNGNGLAIPMGIEDAALYSVNDGDPAWESLYSTQTHMDRRTSLSTLISNLARELRALLKVLTASAQSKDSVDDLTVSAPSTNPLEGIRSADPANRVAARRTLIENFSSFQDQIWNILIDPNETDDTRAALIGVLVAANKPAIPTFRQLNTAIFGISDDRAAILTALAIESDSVQVREEARKFIRSFPYDNVQAAFEQKAVSTNPCDFKCKRTAFAAIYLYYSRIANIILKGREKLTPDDLVKASDAYKNALAYRDRLATSAQIDFIAPTYGFAHVLAWGEIDNRVPRSVKAQFTTKVLFNNIIEIGLRSEDYYSFPHHIYAALAGAKSNDPEKFLEVLRVTGSGGKTTEAPASIIEVLSPEAIGQNALQVFSGPGTQGYKEQTLTLPTAGRLLSSFGNWEFRRFGTTESSFEFGWITKPAETLDPTSVKFSAARLFTELKQVDLNGGDYGVPLRQVSLDQCRVACAKDARCKAFTYDQRNRWCFLKDKVPAQKKYIDAISGVAISRS